MEQYEGKKGTANAVLSVLIAIAIQGTALPAVAGDNNVSPILPAGTLQSAGADFGPSRALMIDTSTKDSTGSTLNECRGGPCTVVYTFNRGEDVVPLGTTNVAGTDGQPNIFVYSMQRKKSGVCRVQALNQSKGCTF